jgi:hypothetical protein
MEDKKRPKMYVVVDHGNTINMYSEEVWDREYFRRLITGKEIGRGMTFEEALAIRKLKQESEQ